MIIPIKKIILEDFDLNTSYISPIVPHFEEYVNTLKSFDNTQDAYDDLVKRGLSTNEKKEMIRGMGNLYKDSTIGSASPNQLRDEDIINKYRMDQSVDMFIDEAKKNFENGNTFRERESDLRRNLINNNSEINHLNNKLKSAERYTEHVRAIGDSKARLYGTGGLIGGGVVGSLLGGVYVANKLKNDENKK